MKYVAAMTALGASLVMGGAALAQSDAMSDDPFVPEGYELTGQTRTCLPLRSIDDITPLNEGAWLVTTNSRDAYVSRVNGGCRAATRPFTYLSYSVPGAQLCRGEIVTVMDQGMNSPVGSCSIGTFEELSPLPEDAS